MGMTARCLRIPRFHNSEGSRLQHGRGWWRIGIQASTIADDGMELHKCTLCKEQRRYNQSHDCGDAKFKLYLNGQRLSADSDDVKHDYNITVSDDIYLTIHLGLRTGDIIL